jgi:RNA-dependent RNA polymerase
MNINVKLIESEIYGYHHDGRGTLTLPTRPIGERFLRWTKTEDNIVRVCGRKLKFYPTRHRPSRALQETLVKVPFIDPDIRQEHERKLSNLTDAIRIVRVQFGVFFSEPGQPGRSFSVEWDRDCTVRDVAWLWINYDHKVSSFL